MSSVDEERRRLALELRAARRQHDLQLEKVEDANELLGKKKQKLKRIETRIADLERRYSELRGGKGSAAGNASSSLRPALLIVNPKSGIMAHGGEMLEEVMAALRAHGIQPELGVKDSAEETRKMARGAAGKGTELIIAAGGDGTIEDVASQLVGSDSTLGIIPIGTMNNIARSLGVPLVLEDACALIGMGVTRGIDVGRAIARARPDEQYFLETAGVGLSAVTIPAGDAAKSRRWEYLPDAIRKLFSIKPQLMEIILDDGNVIRTKSQALTVSNAPLIGNNILIAPDAKMDDGLLEVAVYEEMNKAEVLAYFVAAANGKRVENPKVKFHRSRRVRIGAPEPLQVHSDKDRIEPQTVVEIEVLPAKLSMVVGNGIGLTIPVEAVPSVPPLSGPQDEDRG